MMRINFDTLRRAWKQPFARKVALVSGVVVVGAAGLAAMDSYSGLLETPDKVACCTGALATGESMLSPAIGADKDFFEVPSSPPSVMFLLGTNRSMQDFSTYLPEPKAPTAPIAGTKRGDKGYADKEYGNFTDTGCADPELTTAMNWFDKDSSDPDKNGATAYDGDADLGVKYFDSSQYYFARGWRVAWGGNGEDAPYSMGATFTNDLLPRSAADSCRLINNNSAYYKDNPVSYNECMSCLALKGWWRGPIIAETGGTGSNNTPLVYNDEPPLPKESRRKWVVSGRVLNVRPPKFVVARKVLKDIVDTATNVRMGVANFGEDRGWYDPPWVLRDIAPSCSKSYPEMNEAALDRPSIKKAINKSKFRHNERAVGESLFGLGGYFSSQGVDNRWSQWFDQANIGNDTLGDGSNGGKGMNYWPGNPYGGTINNPRPPYQNTGSAYGRSSDEWLKAQYTDPTTGAVLPGQRFEQGGDNKAVCFACQVSSIIVITDGTPKYDNSVPITKMMKLLVASGARHETPGKELVTFDPSNPKTNTNAGGINYCDQFGSTKDACDYDSSSSETVWNWPHGMAKGNKNFMDDVAFFLAHSDLRTADTQEAQSKGVQSVRTYTIGYGDNSPMLQSIAKAGKGKFYRADSGPQLREALLNALGDIKQMSTSFASSNISGVQTSGMQSSTFVPRFVPRRGRPYEGHLFRFFYFNEFAQGCEPMPVGSSTTHKFDLNGDGDCDDAFYLDKPAGFTSGVPDISKFTKADIVQENDEGNWVQVATAVLDPTTGMLKGGVPAEPFWDLAETLNMRKAGAECDFTNPLNPNGGRCIFTLIDRNKDGRFDSRDNPPIEFHEKNVADLKGYLLAAGDGFCSTLFSKSGADVPWTGSAADQELCARRLVRFVRGVDVFDYDGDNNRSEGRPCADDLADTPTAPKDPTDPEEVQHSKGQKTCKLADIFHSSPVTVEPPVDPFLCSLGLSSQCASTLYEDFSYSVTSEPLCGSGAKPCYKATPLATPRSTTSRDGTYTEYLTDPVISKRDRIALVGSNGGMLHAIHVGTANQGGSGSLSNVYDVGTGQELWAFVPPDLLPKLNLMISGHDYYVDGTAMVRDVWADGSGVSSTRDGIKQKDEFRTLAVIGERSGGQRFTALDVSDPYMMLKAAARPDSGLKPFRWMFPNACEPESLSVGQSWSNFAPKPPPIGPVRIKASAQLESSPPDLDRGWEERWVAVLNGGYSPDLTRGRGLYMLDVWSGDKLWSFEAKPGSGSSSYDAMRNKLQPVAAAPALMDIGKGDGLQRDSDGFFDTMLVGDMGGQVWTFRFKEPGDYNKALGQTPNWVGARSLEVQRNDTSVNGSDKAPFFHVVSSVLQPDTGWLRAFVGTGDRQHLRTTPGADCSADDLLACIRLKCNVKATFAAEVNGKQRNSTIEYVGGMLTSSADTWQDTLGSACTAARMELTALTYSCPDAAYGSAVYNEVAVSAQASCALTNGRWECTRAPLNTYDHHDQKLDATELATVGTNRYFGFHAYGGKRVFNDEASAVTFDKLRVTDKQNVTCEGLNCSLVDVTIPDSAYKTVTVNGMTQRYLPAASLGALNRAKPEDAGWFIRYSNDKSERTASGSTVLAGVVFWSSFSPSTTVGVDVCSLAGMNDKSYSWQADAITGLPDQAAGFKLAGANAGFIASRATKTSAPPGEPTPVIAMSSTGGIRYQVAITSAGNAPTTETLSSRKNTTPDISWMEVPRNVHECRHTNSGACAEEVVAPTTSPAP